MQLEKNEASSLSTQLQIKIAEALRLSGASPPLPPSLPGKEWKAPCPVEAAICAEVAEVEKMLLAAYRRHGRALFDPISIFSRADLYDGLLMRIDSRLALLKSTAGGLSTEFDHVSQAILSDLILIRLARRQAL